jgi:hypothetical protein
MRAGRDELVSGHAARGRYGVVNNLHAVVVSQHGELQGERSVGIQNDPTHGRAAFDPTRVSRNAALALPGTGLTDIRRVFHQCIAVDCGEKTLSCGWVKLEAGHIYSFPRLSSSRTS